VTNLIWSLIKPTHLLLYGFALGLLFWRRDFGRRLLLASSVAFVICAALPIGPLLLAPLEQRFPVPQSLDRVDGIIVLAGAELPGLSARFGHPQFNLYTDRLTTFLLLANSFPQAWLVHSGGGTGRLSQSDPARELVLGTGIDPGRVMFEAESRNTCEGARLARELVRPATSTRWLLVTSAFHMPRAVACFRAVDWDVLPYPTDFKHGESLFYFSAVANLQELDFALHEWIGLAYYRLTGRTHELYPGP
jgi:uncharacterized SAM-binding protein YcdF (DUF218 family)